MGNGSSGSSSVELAVERRASQRHAVADLTSALPIACRITPGHDVRVVNISAVGMLVESAAPLRPGRTAAMHLTLGAGDTRLALNGRIVRSCLIAIDRHRGNATFVSGIAFEHRFDAINQIVTATANANANDRV